MPTTRKRWRKADDGSGALEECKYNYEITLESSAQEVLTCWTMTDWDLVFPDDERDANPTTFKFFQAAQAWAAQRGSGEEGGLSYDMPSDSEGEDDDDVDEADEADGDDVEKDGVDAEAMDEDDE